MKHSTAPTREDVDRVRALYELVKDESSPSYQSATPESLVSIIREIERLMRTSFKSKKDFVGKVRAFLAKEG